jgi:hypothetical protein
MQRIITAKQAMLGQQGRRQQQGEYATEYASDSRISCSASGLVKCGNDGCHSEPRVQSKLLLLNILLLELPVLNNSPSSGLGYSCIASA